MPTVYTPDGRVWSVRRRISPRIPRDACVFDWIDVFGAQPRPDPPADRTLQAGVATAAVIILIAVVAPHVLARAAPLLAALMLVGILLLGRALLGVPTIIEAWPESGPHPDDLHGVGSQHIVVRARGWGAGPRAERDVCAALREGYDFR